MLYVPGEGLFYRLDPRSKLLFVVGLAVYLTFESSPLALLVALAGLHLACALSASTRRRVWPLWRMLAPLALTVLTLGGLRWRAIAPLLRLGPLTVTVASLWQAVGMSVRIVGLSLGLSLLLWTTTPGDMVAGLTRLGVPFELGFPAVMALQYVTTFQRIFYQILEAQQSRGLTLSRGNPIKAARAYVPVIVPLIIVALRSVDTLTLALQSRGFGAGRRRTCRRKLRVGGRDWAFVLLMVCALIGLSRL